jgi:hypothetical protein
MKKVRKLLELIYKKLVEPSTRKNKSPSTDGLV